MEWTTTGVAIALIALGGAGLVATLRLAYRRLQQHHIDRLLADADRLPAARRPHGSPRARTAPAVPSLHRLSARDARNPRAVIHSELERSRPQP
jgi:hypothetical protein